MKQYRKTIGSLNYNTSNVPGAAETRVFIENDPKPYLFNPTYREWSTIHNFVGTPDLKAEQLAELEEALLKHTERRRKAIADSNQWNRHISRIVSNKDNILEISTIYKGSFTLDGVKVPKMGLSHYYNESGGGWLSYIIAHGPDKVKQVRRRVPATGSEPFSPESGQIWRQMEAEMERERAAEEQIIQSGAEETK